MTAYMICYGNPYQTTNLAAWRPDSELSRCESQVVKLVALVIQHVSPFVRFGSTSSRLFTELNLRRGDSSVQRSETLSLISGARYLRLDVSVSRVLCRQDFDAR